MAATQSITFALCVLIITELILATESSYILGVPLNPSDCQIKKVFHRLAMKYHPDKNKSPGAGEFREIAEVFETWSDENKREYDQFGRHGGGNNGSPFHQSSFDFDNLDFDLFNQKSWSKKCFENHFRSHSEAHNWQRCFFQEFSFEGNLFDVLKYRKMFSFSAFEKTH
ncbi:LOW QUALITY PROTEIN: dnaJ homolog subfamily B member 9 [Cariama cristata]